MREPEIRESLPVHKVKDGAVTPAVLRVDGLVGQRLELTVADLERLPQHDFTDDFTCLEGWTVPGVRWGGVLLEDVFSLAEASPQAHYVQASAGEFSLPVPRERAEGALLAIRLHGKSIPPEHGGPVRLVVPEGKCFMQMKWLDHLELRPEAGPNTAETIALGRLPKP